jgi:hypothetical protein
MSCLRLQPRIRLHREPANVGDRDDLRQVAEAPVPDTVAVPLLRGSLPRIGFRRCLMVPHTLAQGREIAPGDEGLAVRRTIRMRGRRCSGSAPTGQSVGGISTPYRRRTNSDMAST